MITKTSETKAHATFSASGSERWLNCPPSIALSENAPEGRESEYAKEGTEAHACLEFLLKNRGKLKQAERLALKKYPLEMVNHALDAISWIENQISDAEHYELLSEVKVDATPFTCEDQFGTLDAAVLDYELSRLTVIDYKYGQGYAVEPEGADGKGNPQLVYYGLGILFQGNNWNLFDEVELVVIQPRAYHESGNTIRSCVLSIKEMKAWADRFRKGVVLAKDPLAPFKAGSWCKFCPAATLCPEIKEKALRDAQAVFSDETGLESVPEPKLITIPNLGKVLSACDKLEDWIAKVREHAIHVLERGGEIDGFKLVQKRGTRKWIDKEKITKEAKKKFGTQAFSEPELLSPAQLEKALKGVKGIDQWVMSHVTTESSGTTLAQASDPRPAVKPITEVFGLVDNKGKEIAEKRSGKKVKH